MGAGKHNRIKECNAARLVKVQASTDDGGGDLHHFKLFIEIELRSHILSWEFEPLEGHVAIFLQNLGGHYTEPLLVKSL